MTAVPLIGTNIAAGELVHTHSSQALSTEQHLITHSKMQCTAMSISSFDLPRLSSLDGSCGNNSGSGQRSHEIISRRHIGLQGQGGRCSRVATSVEKEWSVLGGWVDTVVEGKLQHWQVLASPSHHAAGGQSDAASLQWCG